MIGIKNKISEWFYTIWDSMGEQRQWHRKRINIITEKHRQRVLKKPIKAKDKLRDDKIKQLRKELDKE